MVIFGSYGILLIMKIILAVSGGVDSMVMLDLVAKKYSSDDIIIAHFNHGVRSDSDTDADFVARMAKEIYYIRYIIGKGNLGEDASEELARKARYDFLRRVAKENGNAIIYTAHHLDDLIETITINFVRGTGWRGLASLDSPGIERPLLGTDLTYEPMDKSAIIEYAAKRGLHFREDSTNTSEKYLRNRIRKKLTEADFSFERKMEFWEFWQEQKKLKQEIDQTVQEFLPATGVDWSRKWFRDLDQASAIELLRAGTLHAGVSATRPRLEEFRQAILNYLPGKCFNLPGGKLVKLEKNSFNL